MSTTNSQKVQTLPSDLKSIAEELIAKKFPEEVKRDSSREYFRPERAYRFDGVELEPHVYREQRHGDVSFDPRTRERVVRATIHGRGYEDIAQAMRKLDMGNIPRRGRTLYISVHMYNNLRKDSPMAFDSRMEPTIFGMNIRKCPTEMIDHIEARF